MSNHFGVLHVCVVEIKQLWISRNILVWLLGVERFNLFPKEGRISDRTGIGLLSQNLGMISCKKCTKKHKLGEYEPLAIERKYIITFHTCIYKKSKKKHRSK